MKKFFFFTVVSALVLGAGFISSANAAVVGDIQAAYNVPNTFGAAVTYDGPAFLFENTSGLNITNGVFTIGVGGDNAIADSFNVGTILAGSSVEVIPGLSNDGGAGHTFFAFTGSVLDTSDSGPNSDSVPFSFTGLLNGITPVSTGTFTPAATRTLSNDGTISINFLGNQDPPCNDCFGPTIVATISTPAAGVPDQGSTLSLFAISVAFLGVASLRRKFAKA